MSMQAARIPVLRRLAVGLLLMMAILLLGAVGFMFIEGWPFIEALFVSLLIISTLGFGRLYPASVAGEIFTMVMILGGVGVLYYIVSVLAQTIIETRFGGRSAAQQEARIQALRDHAIVCGFGRVGRQICQELWAQQVPFVVIDGDPERCELIRSLGYLLIQGDATRDEILLHAGVSHARSLLTAVSTDAANVYITLSARALNPQLVIVARADATEAEAKLSKAGATHVVSPYQLGGRRMANLAMRPAVVDFLDVIVHGDHMHIWVEEIMVGAESSLAGVAIGEMNLRTTAGINILAIRHADGSQTVNPSPETIIQAGDLLIALGAFDELRKL